MPPKFFGKLFSTRRSLWLLTVPIGLIAIVVLSYRWAEPLGDEADIARLRAEKADAPKVEPTSATVAVEESSPEWPEAKLEGEEAKRLNLKVLEVAVDRLSKVHDYTAIFHKQERIKGTLGPKQVMEMKVRHEPFSVYFLFIEPQKGKEVVYAQGRHDGKLIAHGGGFSRLLIPRLAVPPDHPLALADARHAITEAGLLNLAKRLLGFRKLDMKDKEAVTVLDRISDEKGRSRFRSVHTHAHRNADRPFARIEVLYDPETFFPVSIRSFDWRDDGSSEELPLAEAYAYEDITLDPPLTALDFDPANPAYSFHRY